MNKEYTYIDVKVVMEDTDRLPFEVKNPKPNKELIEALKEENKILKELKTGKRQGYNNMTNLINSLEE